MLCGCDSSLDVDYSLEFGLHEVHIQSTLSAITAFGILSQVPGMRLCSSGILGGHVRVD